MVISWTVWHHGRLWTGCHVTSNTETDRRRDFCSSLQHRTRNLSLARSVSVVIFFADGHPFCPIAASTFFLCSMPLE